MNKCKKQYSIAGIKKEIPTIQWPGFIRINKKPAAAFATGFLFKILSMTNWSLL